MIVALIYLILTVGLSKLLKRLERMFNINEKVITN